MSCRTQCGTARTQTWIDGLVITGGRTPAVPCLIGAWSDETARLQLADTADIPDLIRLQCRGTAGDRPARVAARTPTELAIVFLRRPAL